MKTPGSALKLITAVVAAIVLGIPTLCVASVLVIRALGFEGPIIGDCVESHDVYVHNATDITVLLYNFDYEPYYTRYDPDLRLRPGETGVMKFEYACFSQRNPERRAEQQRTSTFHPVAFDENRQVIFSRGSTWEQLDHAEWEVEVVKGQIERTRQ